MSRPRFILIQYYSAKCCERIKNKELLMASRTGKTSMEPERGNHVIF